jgi:hypothetical protein
LPAALPRRQGKMRGYFVASAPALATWPSWTEVAPQTPMAPNNLAIRDWWCRSANIVRDHAMILPDDATPTPDWIFGKDKGSASTSWSTTQICSVFEKPHWGCNGKRGIEVGSTHCRGGWG